MTKISLVRHGVHDVIDEILVGRMAGVRLNRRGRDQAALIAEALGREHVDGVQSSPQLRAQETAEPLARRLGLSVEVSAAIDEMNMGAWTGRSFASLTGDPFWSLWNTTRGAIRPPDGESMLELQKRAVDHLSKFAGSTPHGHVALYSHAEVIRAVVMHALKLPLDDFHRVEIAPASISTVAVGPDGIAMIALNRSVVS